MAVTPQETAKVVNFLGSLINGAADLGFSALPLVSLYQKARAENVPFADLLVRDPAAIASIMQALKRQARSLPPAVLDALQEVIREAKEGK
jgi:hypothetical protein